MKNKKFIGYLFKGLAIILLITPILSLCLIKKDVWISTEESSIKLSIGFIIALIFCLMMLKGAFKNLDKRLTTVGTLLTFTVIAWLLDSIVQDLIWILLCSFIGYVVYLMFDTIGTKTLEKAKVYEHEKIRSKARVDFETQQTQGEGRA